jgi:hypothetical protein
MKFYEDIMIMQSEKTGPLLYSRKGLAITKLTTKFRNNE